MNVEPITVFYDGLCPLCSREIAHYRTKVEGEDVAFVDIASADFDGGLFGVDAAQARVVLHVKVGSEMRTGLAAVMSMWDALPAYRWLARFVSLPGIHALASIGYRVFARFRPYLQQRPRRCSKDTCRPTGIPPRLTV
jgi:predicted DCC family thiol-disulfide oxidoreductase YuxK